MTSAAPYWVASCFRAGGARVGATASTSCSNSARVTTVLKSAALDLSTGPSSHNPEIVITAASREILALVPAAGDGVAGLGAVGGAPACPHASEGRNNRHIHPRRVMKSEFLQAVCIENRSIERTSNLGLEASDLRCLEGATAFPALSGKCDGRW